MTKLSSATQAVQKAAKEVYWSWDEMCPADSDTIAAAAIRAAIEQCTYEDAWGHKFLSAEKMFAIADELEESK